MSPGGVASPEGRALQKEATAHGGTVGRGTTQADRRAGPYALICFRAAAWPSTSIAIFFGADSCGAGTLISSMPLAYLALTWPGSTPSGSGEQRSKLPYANSRRK